MDITSTTHGIGVPDLSAGRRWYTEYLGEVPDLEPVPGVIEWELHPGAWLQLYEDEPGSTGGQMLRIGVADIDRTVDRLSAIGIEVGPIERIKGTIAYCEFADPFGNGLSIYQEL